MGFGDLSFDLPSGESYEPSASRLRELADLIPEAPLTLVPPASRRDIWDRLAHSTKLDPLREATAELLAEKPLPYITNELFHHTLKTGSREALGPIRTRVSPRLPLLILMECVENEGHYLPQIERDVEVLAGLDSWCFPSHLEEPHYISLEETFVDLVSTKIGTDLVALLHGLGGKLSPELGKTIRTEVDRRLFEPFEKRIRTGHDLYWWIPCNHNWNSVCLANLLFCALALKETKEEIAWYIGVMEKVLAFSEEGFEESGFYTEGVSYWTYGYSHYLLGAELIRLATGGAIDWLRKPKVERTSHFGARLEIQNGRYPAFADCNPDVKPAAWLMHWYNNRMDPPLDRRDTTEPVDCLENVGHNSAAIFWLIFFRQIDFEECYAVERSTALHDWWEDVQFLICRPRPGSGSRLAATFKGGHNGVNHSHNDLGTFSVLLGTEEMVSDPGKEEYTARTFSQRRYESDLLNSYGHPVPVVAGQLQRPGKDEHRAGGYGSEFRARVAESSFSDDVNRVVLDLSHAYTVESLRKLQRTFEYRRGQPGQVRVVDEVSFDSPQDFETALITYADWSLSDSGGLILVQNGERLRVEVSARQGQFEFGHSVIQASSTPTRLSWKFTELVTENAITIVLTPATED